MSTNVLIAGGGPTGIWLACELQLAGVTTVVLDRLAEIDPQSRALTVHPRTVETFALRDAHRRLLAAGGRLSSGHFAILDDRLDFRRLDTDFPFTLTIPQARTTALLEERARALGAQIRRGHTLTEFIDRGDAVIASVEGPEGRYSLTAEYLVGCDGTRGVVRTGVGIDAEGARFTTLGWLGEVTLSRPPEVPVVSRWGLDGTAMCVALPDGRHRIVGHVPEDARTDHPGELTFGEFRHLVVRVLGTDYGMRSPTWLSRFGNTTRLATAYRRGRVLLAGDAAHQHMPAGGVGLNVGVQDAMNLGWKLAATVNGWAPPDLLDTYHAERHPVGADTIEHTQAQTALMTNFSPEGQALRSLLGKLIAERPQFENALTERLSGLSVRYPAAPQAHPIVGERAPNLALSERDRLFGLFADGRYALVDFGLCDRHTVTDPTPGGDTRHIVRYRAARACGQERPAWSGVSAALIRPDGYIAWATDESDPAKLTAEIADAARATHNAGARTGHDQKRRMDRAQRIT